jgi:hypothetical protein
MAEDSKQTGTAGTSIEAQERAARVEPSGYRGDNPSTAGPGDTGIHSATPENSGGQINPSAPGQTGTTPDTDADKATGKLTR